jgi:hypothetical protein
MDGGALAFRRPSGTRQHSRTKPGALPPAKFQQPTGLRTRNKGAFAKRKRWVFAEPHLGLGWACGHFRSLKMRLISW